ncbi:MAG: hypothetical protein A2600_08595 [Candidatus Lambdaproteobacteria bacterium RIFOXYD1_FULL_56_27]|uniref:Methyl-accepting transducer domain-containing protein n=1 Tax=Candidatus Lambdaproteobacteria bacterium RIFOXYD2_FULL_56_26 TaxID=1817773 RepID=A0A1F6GZ07_9PROT|nr:MAG: hypothetical protein A2426_10015 [Candidatus Lambdaproteobacteria bacterium RIFOXYC1_FULL_56_13]OGH03406.1 MAG: hypothetical protein A2557_02670 [Candidatus Lambdaproteobacteria bacterium RIFOXYD2_FULL_56_26]OGH06589.1 MAG: hypothetical protein A2600_08595 [Candidatus Lambdaproteobacteria bacterium RIFOXYD1_FULL_56_27]
MFLKLSILSRLYGAILGFGVLMGLLFPLYAQFFVDWKPGLKLWFDLGCILAGSMIGLINIWIVKKTLLKTLGLGINMANTLAQGDLTLELKGPVSPCQVGQFLRSLESMRLHWSQLIEKVASNANGLDWATKSLAAMGGKIEEEMKGLQQKTQDMTQLVSETSSSVLKMLESATLVAALTNEAKTQAGRVQEGAQEVEEVLSALHQSMAGISQSSKEVVQVVGTITNIASRTNLLSLNAAIEAAKAGDAGRGFAVVAAEVRLLADQAGQAVNRTHVLIETSNHKITLGENKIGQLDQTFSLTQTAIATISGQVDGVAQVMDRQKSMINGVQENTGRLGLISAEMPRSIQGFAKVIDEVNEWAEEVREMVLELRQEMGAFRLPGQQAKTLPTA